MVASHPASYEGVVLIHNHRPESLRLAEQCQDELQDHLSVPVRTMGTVPDGREANAEVLSKELRAGDAIAVIGGEGTYRDTAGALLLPDMQEVNKNVTITSLNQRGKGCNACDIGKALHGNTTVPSDIFSRKLRAVTAYALETTVRNQADETITYHAMTYTGFGQSARGAAHVNSDRYRQANRIVRDVGVVLRTLLQKSEFTILTQLGYEHVLGELSINKGQWMAKHARFPIRHWDEKFRVTPVASGRLNNLEAMTNLLFGIAQGGNRLNPLSFLAITPVLMHLDGEPPIPIMPVSQVTVGLAPQSYTVLTTKVR